MSVKPQKTASKKPAKVAVNPQSQSIKSTKKTKQPITQSESDDQPDKQSTEMIEQPVSAVKPKKRRAEDAVASTDNQSETQSTAPAKDKKRKLAAAPSETVESESKEQSDNSSQSALPAVIANPDSIEAKLTGDVELNYDFENVDWSKKTESKESDDQSDDKTIKAIKAMGFTKMTEIQARTIPAMMHGVDIMGQAKTGSGKTLSFLIPAVHLLWNLNFKQRNGTGVLIIAPTRELALQIYGVARELTQFHSLTVGCVMGGANRKNEVDKLTKGCNILIGTPGRLLDHMNNTPGFQIANLKLLIMDEADRILEIGFEQELKEILSKLPKNENRQTCLFSATQNSTGIRDLVKLSLKRNPLMINVSAASAVATVSNLEQGYVICPSSQRFLLLFTFLKKNLLKKKKIIVFFSTCAATQFYSELLNYIDLPCLELHGQLKQNKRTSTFFEFINSTHGILLATDVAARGLDIPKVDWIIQFDPPEDPKEYIHRVGRTARGLNSTGGKALLFLLPNELLFLKYLKSAKIPLNEYEFPLNKLATVQNQLEELINKNYYLHKSAREAYRSYLQAYAQHSLKNCFNVHDLNVTEVAASFGFQAPPKVQLKIGIKQKKPQGRHGFDDENPYGEHKLQQEQPARREEAVNEDLNGNAAYEKTAKPAFDRRAKSVKQWSK